jgi:cytochrome bd-type quinol oxidase subunit 2
MKTNDQKESISFHLHMLKGIFLKPIYYCIGALVLTGFVQIVIVFVVEKLFSVELTKTTEDTLTIIIFLCLITILGISTIIELRTNNKKRDYIMNSGFKVIIIILFLVVCVLFAINICQGSSYSPGAGSRYSPPVL